MGKSTVPSNVRNAVEALLQPYGVNFNPDPVIKEQAPDRLSRVFPA
jgi:ABC-type uncharacterized transport system involved in gliding motility auxiliary subunit